MANLNEIIRTDKDAFDSIIDGTHPTETYNDNNLYQVELADAVELGASGSGMSINASNQLVMDTLTLSNISDVTATASEVNILDGNTITTTELNQLSGVTSNIQTQLNNKVSVSYSGTTLETVQYITIDGVEKKLAGGGGGGGAVDDVQVNGTSVLVEGIANITDAILEDVKYTTQSLTDNQKEQARNNIGAGIQYKVIVL